ncbi:TPA: reverse transcriptase domain-containing protein [Salmonella enterica subsp. diarizonae serovar 61:r:-]
MKVREMENERVSMPSKDGMDPNYKRLRFCRYADDFLIGVIGSKEEAREIMREVTAFLSEILHLEASPEKSKISKATDGTIFLGYTVKAIMDSRIRRTKLGRRVVRSRDPAGRIHLLVPPERLVRFNQRNGYGDLGRLKAIHRCHLVDGSLPEIVLAYNAEMRGAGQLLWDVLTSCSVMLNYYCRGILNKYKMVSERVVSAGIARP